MSKTVKSVMIKIMLAILFVATVCFGFTSVNLTNTKAEGEQETTGIFKMANGIWIEKYDKLGADKDQNGMRFKTELNDTFNQALLSKYENAEVKYFNLISTLGEPVAELEFGDELDSDYIVLSYWAPKFDADGNYTQIYAIANIPEAHYADVITVRSGYVITVAGEQKEVGYAEGTDTRGSLLGVSNTVALTKPELAESLGLTKYLGEGGIEINDEVSGVAGLNNKEKIEIPQLDAVPANYTVYLGSSMVNVEGAQLVEEEGKVYVSLPDGALADLATNTEQYLSVMDGTKTYRTKFQVVDYAIETADDFVAWYEEVDSISVNSSAYGERKSNKPLYATLINNVDMSGKILAHKNSDALKGWAAGGFNGQGYTVANLSFDGYMFKAVADGGYEMSNVAFINMQAISDTDAEIFGLPYFNVTMNNVFIDYKTSAIDKIGIAHTTGQLKMTAGVYRATYGADAKELFRNEVPTLTDSILISSEENYAYSNANKKYVSWNEYKGVHYTSAKEAAVGAQKDLAMLENYSDYWTVYNGTLMFKTSTAFADEIYAKPTEVSATISGLSEVDGVYTINETGAYTIDMSQGAVAEVATENLAGVSIDGNTLKIDTTVKNGQQFDIIVSYTDGFWGMTKSKTLTVKLALPNIYNLKTQLVASKNREASRSYTVDLATYNLVGAELKRATRGGETFEGVTLSENKDQLTFSFGDLDAGKFDKIEVELTSDGIKNIIAFDVEVYDFLIASDTEWTEFINHSKGLSGGAPLYAALTGSFKATSLTNQFAGGSYALYLDGKGNTIDSVACRNGMFQGCATSLTIKNIGFTNMFIADSKGAVSSQRGFGYWTGNAATYDNVFMHGSMFSVTSMDGVISYNVNGLSLTNSVFVLDLADTAYALSYQNNGIAKIENAHFYAPNANGIVPNADAKFDGAKLYKTLDEFKAAASAITGEYWTTVGGVPVWETATDSLLAVNSIGATIENETIDEDIYTLSTGKQYELTLSSPALSVKVIDILDGITFTTGTVGGKYIITIPNNEELMAQGFEIELGYQDIYGNVIMQTINIRIKLFEKINYTGDKIITGLNRKDVITYDVSTYAIDSIISATLNYSDVSDAISLSADNKLQINPSKLVKADDWLKIEMTSGKNEYFILMPFNVVNYAIENETEFESFYNKLLKVKHVSGNKTEVLDVVLTNNITLTKTYDNTVKDYKAGGTWRGSLDGQGFVISNLTGSSSAGCEGVFTAFDVLTIKNVAFVNLTTSTRNLFATSATSLTLENVYMEFKSTASTGSLRHGLSGNADYITIKNSVLKFEYPKVSYPVYRVGEAGKVPTFENAITIANQNYFTGFSKASNSVTTVPSGATWYKTQADANQAIINANYALPTGLSAKYWAVDNTTGELYWINSRTPAQA